MFKFAFKNMAIKKLRLYSLSFQLSFQPVSVYLHIISQSRLTVDSKLQLHIMI